MIHKKILMLFSCFSLMTITVDAAGFNTYLEKFKKTMNDCSIDYEMSYNLEGKNTVVKGKMAMKGDNYFDSSNSRFVLMNDRWFLSADHINKYISVVSLEKLKKETHAPGKPDISSFMFSNNYFMSNLVVKEEKKSGDTVILSLSLKNDLTIEKLEMKFLRSTNTVISYSAVIRYPLSQFYMDDELDPAAYIKIYLTTNRISFPAASGLFDERRLLDIGKNKTTLKRYRNYNTLKPN